MSDEISAAPVPWKVADRYVMRDARDIRDANGALVAVGVSSADARLIVDSVNWFSEEQRDAMIETTKERDELVENLKTAYENRERENAEWVKFSTSLRDERDLLRDIVRKTLLAIDALYTAAAPGAIVKELTPDRTCIDIPIGKIFAEARAAIGEDAPSAPCAPAPSVVSSPRPAQNP